LLGEYTRTIAPARALAAETLPLEHNLKADGRRMQNDIPALAAA
jgi:hypothetical protein